MGKSNNIWMSFSDLMTGLMVIFMFIAIAYILKVQMAEKSKESLVSEYKDTKNAIYLDLTATFEDKFQQWNMEVGKDLTIRFTNPNIMFEVGQSELTPCFQNILNEFFPKYFNVLLQEKYRHSIKEIRIEGHTDDTPIGNTDSYTGNLYLSQLRSANVLVFFRNTKYYKSLSVEKQRQLQYWITANGLSYGRALDNKKNEVFISLKPINKDYSRRVEFKIITSSEELIEEIIKKIE